MNPVAGKTITVDVNGERFEREASRRGRANARELVDAVQVDEHVRRRRARLHDVDQRLTAGERARVRVLGEQTHRVRDALGTRVLDLPQ